MFPKHIPVLIVYTGTFDTKQLHYMQNNDLYNTPNVYYSINLHSHCIQNSINIAFINNISNWHNRSNQDIFQQLSVYDSKL